MPRSTKFAATVIIPVYDRREMLDQSLRSLTKSRLSKDDFEIVVVDDGSSDQTFEVVQSFRDSCQIRYVYQQDDGYRVGRARNFGIDLAEGRVCIFLDGGIVVSQNFVEAHVRAHDAKNAVVLGYLFGFNNTGDGSDELAKALVMEVDVDDVDSALNAFIASGRFPDMRNTIYEGCADQLSALPAPWAIGWGGNISVRRETLGDDVRFDENYRTWGAEDIDFSLTLFERGAQFVLARGASGIHLPHPRSHEDNSRSSRPNKIYLHGKFKRPETELLIDVQSWDLNDALIRGRRP